MNKLNKQMDEKVNTNSALFGVTSTIQCIDCITERISYL